MLRKHLCSLVVCGNRGGNGKFTEKIEWIQKTLGPLAFAQVGINQLIYAHENISLELFLVQGERDSIELCHRIRDNRDFIVVNGACCSLDDTICVGSIFLPNFAVDTEGHQVAFSPFLLRRARQLTERYCETCGTGKIIQVRDVITEVSDLKGYGVLSNTCIDQETAVMGTICGETTTKLCAVLYVSDNLSLKQNLKTVNLNPTLLRKKMLAKRNSLFIAVRTIMECVTEYEST